MEQFINYLDTISKLTEAAKADLKDRLRVLELGKNASLLKQGQVCNYLYFVNEGLLRLYYYRDGVDITDYFAPEGRIMGGIDSFFSRRPSEKSIEALEACRLTAISFNDLEALYSRHHDMERLGRLLSIGAFLSMQQRLFSIQFLPAKERYRELVQNDPGILLRVPLKHIASYLGITQVSLSRIRSRY